MPHRDVKASLPPIPRLMIRPIRRIAVPDGGYFGPVEQFVERHLGVKYHGDCQGRHVAEPHPCELGQLKLVVDVYTGAATNPQSGTTTVSTAAVAEKGRRTLQLKPRR